MVMMFGGGCCVGAHENSRTIHTAENLRGEIFLFPPEPLLVKLLTTFLDLLEGTIVFRDPKLFLMRLMAMVF